MNEIKTAIVKRRLHQAGKRIHELKDTAFELSSKRREKRIKK